MKLASLDEALRGATTCIEFFTPSFCENDTLSKMIVSQASLEDRDTNVRISLECGTSIGIEALKSRDLIDVQKVVREASRLSEFHKMGCKVSWHPYLQNDYIFIDRNLGYTYDKDKKSFHNISSHRPRRLSLKSGYFTELVGKIVFVQELTPYKPNDVDLIIRLEENQEVQSENHTSHEGLKSTALSISNTPIFLHSGCLSNRIDYVDIVDVSAILNIAGEPILGSTIPASMFLEGLGVNWITKAESDELSSLILPRLKFRDEVLNLLRTDSRFKITREDFRRSSRKKQEWIIWAFNEVQRILREKGLYMQTTDDSFIVMTLDKLLENPSMSR